MNLTRKQLKPDKCQATLRVGGEERLGAEKTGAQKESFPWGWIAELALKDN